MTQRMSERFRLESKPRPGRPKKRVPTPIAFPCQPVSPFCTRCKLVKYCDRVGVTRSR